jgi:Kef-type K+ transport system membrane component KefB
LPSASEILLFLLLDLAIIIVAARVLGGLAIRAGQPAVIGEIVAGILLGPSVLGRILPEQQAHLFPPGVPLRQLADLGLIFFMFLVGLELDTRLIRKEGRRALAISSSGVAVPFVLGALIGVPLLAVNNGGVFVGGGAGGAGPPTPMAFSLFMGAAMCITAFPVLARILVERGLYKSPLGTTALCAAAVDDVTAWILLAGVVGLARTGSASEAAIVLLRTGLFAVLMLTAGRWLFGRLSRRYEATGRLTVDQAAAVIVGVLVSACATEWIGIHAIFGAFMAGAMMPHRSRLIRELIDRIEDFTVIVLLPVFFTVAGLRTNLFALDSLQLIGWTALVTGAAIAGKLAGCGAAAMASGYSVRDALTLGTLMNTRGLTELVILTVGLNLGVLSDRVYAMMVLMALLTTFMAAPILNRLMPRRQMVRVLAGGDPGPGVRRVLVALGNPDNARALVDGALRLMGRERPAELLLVRLIPTPWAREFRSGLRDEESQIDSSIEAMERLTDQAEAAGVRARAVSFLSDDVALDLALVAETQRCSAILIGWHRASLERHVVRALLHTLFRLASADVAVFVDRRGVGVQPEPAKTVLLVASAEDDDGSPTAIAARIAESLQTIVRTVAIAGAHPGEPDALAHGSAVVVAAGPDFDRSDFGEAATAVAGSAECPVFVVRRVAAASGVSPMQM